MLQQQKGQLQKKGNPSPHEANVLFAVVQTHFGTLLLALVKTFVIVSHEDRGTRAAGADPLVSRVSEGKHEGKPFLQNRPSQG